MNLDIKVSANIANVNVLSSSFRRYFKIFQNLLKEVNYLTIFYVKGTHICKIDTKKLKIKTNANKIKLDWQ